MRSLTRTLSVKAKEVKAKLGDNLHLPSMEEAKQSFSPLHKAEYARRHAALIQRHTSQLHPHMQKIHTEVEKQKAARIVLEAEQAQRQQNERNARQAQYQKGLKALFHYILGRTHKLRKQHEAEYQAALTRDKQEKENLMQRQLRQRQVLQQPVDALKVQHDTEIQHFNRRFLEVMHGLGIKDVLIQTLKQEQKQHQANINTQRPEWDI